jgi:hypothetical protein
VVAVATPRNIVIGLLVLLIAVIGAVLALAAGGGGADNDGADSDSPLEASTDSDTATTTTPGSLSLTPDRGTDGTTSTIAVKDVPAGSSVMVTFSDGTPSATFSTNNAGAGSMQQIFVGKVGDQITVTATVTRPDSSSYKLTPATFTITNLNNVVPTTVTLSPSSGPSGTVSTITVTGEANKPITITIAGQATTNGRTDAQGRFTTTHTFNDKAGSKVKVEAQVGSTGVTDSKGSADFTVTGTALLQGGPHTFVSSVMVSRDPAGHGPFIVMRELMRLLVTIHSITVEGEAPFVTVTGDIADDGSFRAEGSGTVAGFPDVTVVFQGRLDGDRLVGEYTMGAGGELPGGESITYTIDGLTTTVPNSYTVTVEVTVASSDPTTQETHLTVGDDGQIMWFTDCGEPVG